MGIAVSTSLFPAHEGELFHLNCTLRLSSTMTRLDLNRNASARRAETRLATPLWAGKSRANATASVRGQRGEPARGKVEEFWAAQSFIFCSRLTFGLPRLPKVGKRLPLAAFSYVFRVWVCFGLSRLLRQGAASCLILVGGKNRHSVR